jgi:hypothetical protein
MPQHQALERCLGRFIASGDKSFQELGVGETTCGSSAEERLEETGISPEPGTHRLDSPADLRSLTV